MYFCGFAVAGGKCYNVNMFLEGKHALYNTANLMYERGLVDTKDILNTTKSDKKMENDQLKFILLKKIGKAIIDKTVTEEELKSGIEEIIYRDEFE